MAEQTADIRLSRGKAAAFSAAAVLIPLIGLGILELALRLAGYGGNRTLFVPAAFDSVNYLVPNPRFAARYFPGDPSPPTPPTDAFRRDKPVNAFRLLVVGESTTAGFPFPSNGTFSRILADALRDVLPTDTIEVINVGIPATNSFAIYDELPDILDVHPDAVLIYAGHNEYYGAYGSASTVRLGGRPSLVRLVLRLERLRTVLLLQRTILAARGRFAPAHSAPMSVSRMEELAGRDTLRFGGAGYSRGVAQFASNLGEILSALHAAKVRTYVASLGSNLRDQPPFASDTGTAATSANAAFAAAHVALGIHDASAESLFARARDLDLIRFRAPGEFNAVIQRVAAREQATYVPVAEAFRADAPDHVPGKEMFFEHIHPRPAGATLIAHTFFDALSRDHFLGRRADSLRRAPWTTYTERMALTALDQRIAGLITDALTHRWPFVPRAAGGNILADFRATTLTDSLALDVVTGARTWVAAKLAQAGRFESAGDFQSAVEEYRGLMRDQPWNESPFRFAARALLAAKRPAEARPMLEQAYALGPTAFTCLALEPLVAADSGGLPRAAALLQQALRLGGFNPGVMYQLSLVLARQGNVAGARTTAAQLYSAAPTYPGLREWMKLLGM